MGSRKEIINCTKMAIQSLMLTTNLSTIHTNHFVCFLYCHFQDTSLAEVANHSISLSSRAGCCWISYSFIQFWQNHFYPLWNISFTWLSQLWITLVSLHTGILHSKAPYCWQWTDHELWYFDSLSWTWGQNFGLGAGIVPDVTEYITVSSSLVW